MHPVGQVIRPMGIMELNLFCHKLLSIILTLVELVETKISSHLLAMAGLMTKVKRIQARWILWQLIPTKLLPCCEKFIQISLYQAILNVVIVLRENWKAIYTMMFSILVLGELVQLPMMMIHM